MVKAAIAAAIVSFSVAGWLAYDQTNTFTANDYAFDYVCDVIGADCTELEAPTVRYGPYRALMGALGFYWFSQDANSIYLDVKYEATIESGDLTQNPEAWSVLVHETAHYVDRHLGITSQTPCAAETLGWHVGNVWLWDHGYGDQAVWNWWVRYDSCRGPEG